MSEQIREQVSAFLDGELPNSETELLLKRLTRDGELRESFGRYALIGEAVRGGTSSVMTKGFAGRVNLAIDGEPIPANGRAQQIRAARWWRPFAGAAVAAGVAAVAVVALQQRAVAPGLRPGATVTAQGMVQGTALTARGAAGSERRSGPGRRPATAPRGRLLYGAGDLGGGAHGHAAGAADQLRVRAQPIFLRPRSARSAGGFAHRSRGTAASGPRSGGARCSMTRLTRHRANWLIPCAVVGALLAGVAAALPTVPTIRAYGCRR